MNIVSKDILHPCTSCGGCAAVCPANAIVMVLNEQGFYRPVLDVDKCVDCSLCTKVCYKYDDVKPYNIAEHKEILMLACQARDNATLNTTTSGGIAYLLAKALYRQGYKCIGVVYDTLDDSAKHVCAADEKDIQATLDFMNWCVTSDDGVKAMCKDMGFTIPFKTAVAPTNVFVKQDAEYTEAGLTPVSWNFTTMPSEEWKNGLGTALTLYAAGSGSWDDVVSAFVDNWATEKALSE